MEAGPLDRPYRDEGDMPEAPPLADGVPGGLADDAPPPEDDAARLVDLDPADSSVGGQQSPDENALRPERRLRIWHTAPIVALGVLGSLMFAFPLAFEFGGGGAVVAMLGLLISASSAGGGIMVARRVGYTWPGLPQRGSGDRPDWRFVLGYAAICLLIAALAVWRVARLQ